jgi:hypothetical protein
MLRKVVGAALLTIGVSLFTQLDQRPDMRGPRLMDFYEPADVKPPVMENADD